MSGLRVQQLLLKVAARCNINCSYCFEYNLADSSYLKHPKFMDLAIVRQAICSLVAHCREMDVSSVSIVLHGGEPLLLGAERLDDTLTEIRRELAPTGIQHSFGMQSNGILFTRELGHVLRFHKCGIGISVDGPPKVNDRHRLTFAGEGSSVELERAMRLLTGEFGDLFAGTLSVIDPFTDPADVIDYLHGLQPPEIDFLLPLFNHSRPPLELDYVDKMGAWLIRAFDYTNHRVPFVGVRMFQNIIRELCGAPSRVESIGADVGSLIVVGTSGQIEALDALKATYDGATDLGLNVFRDSLSSINLTRLIHPLCATCADCKYVDVCGGGYIPHRYSSLNAFDNPSIYCAALQALIEHIERSLKTELGALSHGRAPILIQNG